MVSSSGQGIKAVRHVISENDWNRTARFWNSNEPAGIRESKSFNSVILICFFFFVFFFLPKN